MTNHGGPDDPESEPFGSLPEDEDDGEQQGDSDAGDVGTAAADDDHEIFEGDPGEHDLHSGLPPKVEAWRRRSATGAILTGFALGLQQALGKEQEQPAIVMQTSGDPPMDLPVEAEVEQGRPRQSVVNIRPWLLPDRRDESEASGEGDPDPTRGDA